jgi:hypothetical protein
MLHHQVGSPQEFKLAVNLRSPRRIARVINSVWGLYSTVAKQDRPSGWKEAEIEDEASDQLLYCAATPGAELDQLLRTFADREGLAIISFTERPPDYLPGDLKGRVLTVYEAKGLDFQSVCILDPGRLLQKILAAGDRVRRDFDVEPLSRRLAIDQLRVAVSRPTERIYFLDVAPTDRAREQILSFLRWADEGNEIAAVIPAAVLKTLEEELLEPEERVHLCEVDARQYLEVKPEMAWVRAKQAVALLGPKLGKQSVTDETVRQSAHLTLAQVSFVLAMRQARLPAEVGHPNLFQEAAANARFAHREVLADMMEDVAAHKLEKSPVASILLAQAARDFPAEVESWFAMEVAARAPEMLKDLEQHAESPEFASKVLPLLPAAYKLFGVVDATERYITHRHHAIGMLMTTGKASQALPLIEENPDASPELKAQCLESMQRFADAAELYRSLGKRKEALRNYRAIPDLQKALELMRELGGEQAAAESLEWLAELRRVTEKRPANFARTATAAEKKFLTALLEAQLDGPRVKKAPVKRTPRKPAAKAAKAPASKRT